MSDEDWHFTLRNELDSVFFASRAAWPYLTRPGAVVINIGSVSGLRGTTAGGGAALRGGAGRAQLLHLLASHHTRRHQAHRATATSTDASSASYAGLRSISTEAPPPTPDLPGERSATGAHVPPSGSRQPGRLWLRFNTMFTM